MASAKQIEANRRNAQKSTGPKTQEGKLKSRLNSLKHGLGALHVPLPHEDPEEYHTIRQGLINDYQPATTQEHMLVETIAHAWFRIQRASRFEAALMNGHILTLKKQCEKSTDPTPGDDLAIVLSMADRNLETAWLLLDRYEKRAQSAYYKGIEALRKVQNDRKREPARQLKEEKAREDYLKRTVAPISPEPPTPMASFSRTEIRGGAGPRRADSRPKVVRR